MTDLKHLSKLAAVQMDLEDRLEDLEAQAKEIKEKLAKVAEVDIPEAMDAADMEEFTMSDGSKISVKVNYAASISKKNQAEAFAWLRKNNLDGLIRHDVKIPFKKGEEETVQKFLKWATKNLPKQDISDKENVHAGTLKAFVREQIENGENIPMELFEVHKIVRATVTRSAH